MVKVTGPMMSMDASGSLGGAVVFSKWKGRNYVRTLVKPANPRSALQVSMRAMFGFLAQQWAGFSPTEQASWEALAEQLVASPFDAYMKTNQTRWRNGLYPTKDSSFPTTAGVGTVGALTATGGIRQITLAQLMTAVADNWGLAIYRSPTAVFTPSLSNCVKIIRVNDPDTAGAWVDTPLVPGDYWYETIPFDWSGVAGTPSAEATGTVT